MGSIAGTGVDIVETERVFKAAQKKSFLDKCYTAREQELIKKRKSCAASNFAGKEAVAKAFGTGFTNFFPDCIEILRKENGMPYVNLYGKARETASSLGIDKIHISLSDTKEMAIAYVICEKKSQEEKRG